ncbi:MAG: MFS transporter [Desulfobulbaceae bacterium]|nr:MFS transporter [Desulfobulbaceae bacterium]
MTHHCNKRVEPSRKPPGYAETGAEISLNRIRTPQPPTTKPFNKSLWTFSTYFAEGFPYTIIRTVSSLFFRVGMSLEALGVTSIFGLPWVLKFLWGPLIDAYSSKRSWLLFCEAFLVLIIVTATILSPLLNAIHYIAILFFLGSFIAATHDIAIDGYYLEALNQAEQAQYLGFRVMAYRIAMMTGTGVIVTVGAMIGWSWAFALASLIMGALFSLHSVILPQVCQQKSIPRLSLPFRQKHAWIIGSIAATLISVTLLTNRSTNFTPLTNNLPAIITLSLFAGLILIWYSKKRLQQLLHDNPDSFYAKSFLSFIDQPKIGAVLGFIILCRAGEYMLSCMYSPFMVDLGLKTHYGWISAGVGLPCSIAGAMLGGWAISRTGLKRTIWPFLLLQNLTNIAYMILALHYADLIGPPPPTEEADLSLLLSVASIHGFDQFAGGLGTAVLMTFLMRLCHSDFKASHYAIGTGLMSISGLYAGVISGFLTAWLGYGLFFGISFLLSIPGMAMVFFLPIHENESTEEQIA